MQAVLPSFMAYFSNIVYVIRGPGAFCSAKITQKHKIKVQEEKSFLKRILQYRNRNPNDSIPTFCNTDMALLAPLSTP
jgi:hypothetical protein